MTDVHSMPPLHENSPAEAVDDRGLPVDPDAELVGRLRARDERAFELVVRRYTPRLMAVAARFLRSPEDRADAVQDAFLCAFRSLPSFEGRARLSTWLHRIVVNVCLVKLRARARATLVPLRDLLPSGTHPNRRYEPFDRSPAAPLSCLSSAETRAQVRACIDRLPEAYRTVLVLRDLKELDTGQAARAIGVTPGAVKTRLHRARGALRAMLAPLVGA
jgi:RNA polymerase sigma-70 factor (ECF subfamily)